MTAEALATNVAKDAGFSLKVTENGRRLQHRIELSGGVAQDSLANQPAVRAVMRKALDSPYGVNAKALRDVV